MNPKSALVIATMLLAMASCVSQRQQGIDNAGTGDEFVVIGYMPGFRGEIDETTIDANKLTHINYAFVAVKDSMAWLTNITIDTINFRRLNSLKKINPSLKILISLRGWSWSENFSDAVLTENSRRKFARTNAAIVAENDLDSVDIDWEYPGMRGQDNVLNYYKEQSGDRAFKEYTQAGVPSKKLVLGIPFYGRSWYMKSDDNRGINRGVDSLARGGGYTFVKDSIATRPGFVRYWDDKAKAPYLWNAKTKQLVTYDGEESVKLKCAYVREHKMADVMFWQYASDPKESLKNAIHETRQAKQ